MKLSAEQPKPLSSGPHLTSLRLCKAQRDTNQLVINTKNRNTIRHVGLFDDEILLEATCKKTKNIYPTFDTLTVNTNISDLEQSMCRLPTVRRDVLDPSLLVEWQRTSHSLSFCIHSHLPQQVFHSE